MTAIEAIKTLTHDIFDNNPKVLKAYVFGTFANLNYSKHVLFSFGIDETLYIYVCINPKTEESSPFSMVDVTTLIKDISEVTGIEDVVVTTEDGFSNWKKHFMSSDIVLLYSRKCAE